MNSEVIAKQRALAFDYLYDAVVVTDLEGVIIDWNKGSETLYGYSKEEAIGKPVGILHVPEDLDHVTKDVLDGIMRDGKWNGEVRMLRKDGTIGWIESMCVPLLDEQNQAIGALGINRDITQRIEQEKQFFLQSKFVQMGEMLAMIAHQWRQPLSAITAASVDARINLELNKFVYKSAEDIQKNELYFLEKFQNIENYASSLSEVINGFRKYFKAEKVLKSFKIKDVVTDALTLLNANIEDNEITVEIQFDDLPEIANYAFELEQVVINLLKNALDAMQDKALKNGKIILSLSSSERGEKLIVFNSGTTISQENLSKIFEPYFSTKGENGMGLGLYMSKVMIEEHCSGRLDVEILDDGVAFTIDLPMKISS